MSKNGLHAHRLVRLAVSAATLLVAPDAARKSDAFEPFPLPRLPVSLALWLSPLGGVFRRERSACLAAVLLLDRPARRWATPPALPTQHCCRRGSRWRLRRDDFVALPGHLLMTLVCRGVTEAAGAVPPFDGLHLVEQAAVHFERPRDGGGHGAFWIFLRVGGEVQIADPAAVVCDDLRDALRRNADRLRVG